MDELKPKPEDVDVFVDALDEFPSDDSTSSLESTESTVSQLEDEPFKPEQPTEFTNVTGLRRRQSFSQPVGHVIPDKDLKDSNIQAEYPSSSEVDRILGTVIASAERRYKLYRKSRENEKTIQEPEPARVQFASSGSVGERNDEKSTSASVNKDPVDDSISVDSLVEVEGHSSSFLVSIAGLVTKFIGFQFNLFVTLFTFPVSSLYYSFAFIVDPFGTTRRGREYLVGKLTRILGVAFKIVRSVLYKWAKEYGSFLKLTLRFSWGLFWSAYVCIILIGLLVSSFLMSGLTMRFLVEEPLQRKETLYFDYTMDSPVAFVPITLCPSVSCGVNCKDEIEFGKGGEMRVIHPHQKFQATVSLTLPESDYNRNLGIFQVRVDCLSANGVVLASSRHPCMLPFRSEPIRLLLTSLKVVPLLAGYLSESHTMNLKIRDFTEGNVPTACVRVMLEQRAEYRPGAGIPEMYAASLLLESDLPLLKRILWNWKSTIFIWIGMTYFTMGLIFTLLCCTPMLIPRTKPREGSTGNSRSQSAVPGDMP
ncbi:seipin-2-like [Malania oleifera]|uniref:seipin-2-like n=1 Tax=Malania oleifera TaxID=397392 RepID=UPI0025AE141D|nr:seipin-2-like [Malania oleifera]